MLNIVFIDAGHEYNQIMMDIERIIKYHNLAKPAYFIFDDFGMKDGVNKAITHYMNSNIFEYVCDIGHPITHNFGGNPERILRYGSEGVICKYN